MRAPIPYYGGKTGAASEIVALMPEHRVYIEPFFGSGAVFFAKQPAQHEILNDKDQAVVTFFRVLRDQPGELARVCSLTPHARDEWTRADLDADMPDMELARQLFCRVTQSFAKTGGRKTGWSVTTARTQSVPASNRARIARFAACADRLGEATIENCDAADLVRRLATADAVIYADPPYLAETRRSRKNGAVCEDYRVDMGDTESHEDLADALTATTATVFISGYHSPLYDRLYDGWDRLEWRTHAHGSNALTTERGARIEVLWSNRPIRRPETQLSLDDLA